MDAFFVNLQYGDTSAEVGQFSAENDIKIYDWEDNDALLDLDNQAALISTLDLVISSRQRNRAFVHCPRNGSVGFN